MKIIIMALAAGVTGMLASGVLLFELWQVLVVGMLCGWLVGISLFVALKNTFTVNKKLGFMKFEVSVMLTKSPVRADGKTDLEGDGGEGRANDRTQDTGAAEGETNIPVVRKARIRFVNPPVVEGETGVSKTGKGGAGGEADVQPGRKARIRFVNPPVVEGQAAVSKTGKDGADGGEGEAVGQPECTSKIRFVNPPSVEGEKGVSKSDKGGAEGGVPLPPPSPQG